MGITKADIVDLDIVDSFELASDGYTIYLETTLVSTNATGNVITINLPTDGEGILFGKDHLAQTKDRVWLVGTSGGLADGYYIVDTIIDDISFSVNSAILSSTGGTVYFMYQGGAKNVGFDLLNYSPIHVAHTNVQEAIQDLDRAIAFSSFRAKQIEVDFGTFPTNYKTFTIIDSDVGVGSKLFPTQAGNAPTGRSADENEMDPIIFSATPSSEKFTLIASTKDGPVVGKYKVNYGIG